MLNSLIGVLLQDAKEVRDEVVSNINTRGVRASGKTEAAIRYLVEETDHGLKSQVIGPAHIKALEDGRGPTKKKGSGKTLTEIIRQWIDDKGITPEYGTKDSMAKGVSYFIHKKGTLLYQKGGNSGLLTDVINQDRLKRLRDELIRVGFEDLREGIKAVI